MLAASVHRFGVRLPNDVCTPLGQAS